MKIFTASALIETETIWSLDQEINCHNGYKVFPPRRKLRALVPITPLRY